MIDPKQYPLCEQQVANLKRKYNDNGWVTISSGRMFSCLMTDEEVVKSMQTDNWDLNHSQTGPLINEKSDGTFISYFKHWDDGVEPLVYYVENEGRWPEEVFLSDEFVMYFKLHKEYKGRNDSVYFQVDECGDDVEVARINGTQMLVKLKYLKEFIAVKKCNLLIFVDEVINSIDPLSALGGSEIPLKLITDGDILFSYALSDSCGYGMGYKSSAVFRGKCVYRHNDNDIQHLWKLRDSRYEEFITGCDENGNEIYTSCNEHRIPNLFTWSGEGPYSLTPVFFHRDVLSRYYQEEEKYTVHDGYLEGPSWGVRIDNDRLDDYIVMALVDLGRMPYKEQNYWRSYNIMPPSNGDYSQTTLKRWFEGQPTNSSSAPDLLFKKLYVDLYKKWDAKFGWPLYKELAEDDRYHFTSLHTMGKEDDQKEFDGLIQSVTKLVIDSLNEKKLVDEIDEENPVVKAYLTEKSVLDAKKANIKGGISKFECYLVDRDACNDEFVKLLRQIQDLRSCTVAHRKSTKLDNKTKQLFDYFGIGQKSDKTVFSNLLGKLNEMFEWLISLTEK